MSHAELWTKFADCAGRSLPAASVAPAFETLSRIVNLPHMDALTRLLMPATGAGK
jgi:hypothetical protein